MENLRAWVALLIGANALFAFVQFLITRHDNKKNIGKKLDEVEHNLTAKIEANDKNLEQHKAIESRRGILRFADDLKNGIDHSEDFFRQTLVDVNCYEKYCLKNPAFENGYTALAAKFIKEEFEKKYMHKGGQNNEQ